MHAAAVVLAVASSAFAAPVAFDNSAHQYTQTYYDVRDNFAPAGACFDPALPATAQPAPVGGNCSQGFTIRYLTPIPNNQPGNILLGVPAVTTAGPGPHLDPVPQALALGAVVGPSSTFNFGWLAYLQAPSGSGPQTTYLLTSGAHVGFKWAPGGTGPFYGWIRYAYNANPGAAGISRWQPVEWALETTPNIPIRVNTYACTIAGDFTADGVTNFADLNEVLSSFGSQFSFAELNTVLSSFGTACR